MPASEIFNSELVSDIWHIAKYFYLVFFFLYTLFALIVVRQIKLMVQTIDGQMSPIIKIIGIIHLVFAFVIFLLAILVL